MVLFHENYHFNLPETKFWKKGLLFPNCVTAGSAARWIPLN